MDVVERDQDRLVVLTESEEETRQLAALLGEVLQPGDVVALHGELGAGKTRFAQGMARGLGITTPVTSPTFVLMNLYRAPDGRVLCHVDCYRLRDGVEEGYDLGLDQQLRGEEVCVVEWAERIIPLLPGDHIWVDLDVTTPDERRITLQARGPRAVQRVQALAQRLS